LVLLRKLEAPLPYSKFAVNRFYSEAPSRAIGRADSANLYGKSLTSEEVSYIGLMVASFS